MARKKREPEPKKGNWTVRVKCVVTKEVYCDNCTEEEARKDPWRYAEGEEIEIDQEDWEVQKVEPNE